MPFILIINANLQVKDACFIKIIEYVIFEGDTNKNIARYLRDFDGTLSIYGVLIKIKFDYVKKSKSISLKKI